MPRGRTPKGCRALAGSMLSALLLSTLLLVGCATTLPHGGAAGKLNVVAAENFWGALASELGGDKVRVISLIDNPATDPHDYEPTAADARVVATAQVVVVNGVGYDSWASKLIAANPANHRQVLTVGKLVDAAAGANPHRWYNPADVHTVVAAITDSLSKADPADAAYFAARRKAAETGDLATYDEVIAEIKQRFAGTPVGASESIFSMLAPALGLNVLTPPTLLRAISEGTDPTSRDKTAVDAQLKDHQVKVYVYNSQNATPDVQAQVEEAKAAGIPVTTITETLVPATATFEQWQTNQLRALESALAEATGGSSS